MRSEGVLVPEGNNLASLPVTKSLEKNKVRTAFLTNYGVYPAFFSRRFRKHFLAPSTSRQEIFARAVEKLVKRVKFDAIFPLSEWTLTPLSEDRKNIEPYVNLPIASQNAIQTCLDKDATLELAKKNGVPVPKTINPKNTIELKDSAEKIGYPCVVKPRWSVVWTKDCAYSRRAGFVNSPAEMIAAYEGINRFFPHPLIQEYVPGVNYSVAALYNHGSARAFCCIKVQRAWPRTGGNSCCRESAPLDSRMKGYAERLLEDMDWHGIAEVEFRLDARDGTPRMMEINPRFWGSLSVAIGAGVDFPYLLYKVAADGDCTAVSGYKVGVKGRYLEQELLYLTSLLKNSQSNTGSGGNLRMLANWLRLYEPDLFYDLFELDDPLPFFFDLVTYPLALARFLKDKSCAWSPPHISF